MTCQTFWQLVWTNKERGASLSEAVQAALKHFDECGVCQADTNPDYLPSSVDLDACHARAAQTQGEREGG